MYALLSPDTLAEAEKIAKRLDRSLSWVVSQAVEFGLADVAKGHYYVDGDKR